MNDDTRKFFEKLAGVSQEETEEVEPTLTRATVAKAERVAKVEVDNSTGEGNGDEEEFDEGEGQLAIDVYQTDADIVVEAPIAGVSGEDLDIDISPESISIKGKRARSAKNENRDYLYQECYWGKFSRSIILPQEIDANRASASFKNGVLKISMPKADKMKAKKLRVKFE